MRLRTKIGFGRYHIVLDGDPAPPNWGHSTNYRPMSVDQDVTWYGGRHLTRRHCVKISLGTEVALGPGDVV